MICRISIYAIQLAPKPSNSSHLGPSNGFWMVSLASIPRKIWQIHNKTLKNTLLLENNVRAARNNGRANNGRSVHCFFNLLFSVYCFLKQRYTRSSCDPYANSTHSEEMWMIILIQQDVRRLLTPENGVTTSPSVLYICRLITLTISYRYPRRFAQINFSK